MNYATLKAQVIATTHRKDLDLDGIQELAAAEIGRDLDVIDNEGMQPLTISTELGTPLWSAALPDNFQRVKALIGGGQSQPWAALDLQALFGLAQANRSGYFAISGSKVYLGGPGPLVLIYGQALPLLIDDADTNVILTKYPNVYLHAMVKWSYQRIEDADMAGLAGAEYALAVAAANADKAFATRTAGAAPQIVGSY